METVSTWAAHLEQGWFAVALSARVGRKPQRVWLLDRPIVLVRLDGHAITALQDRCPHRHAPLSRGRVVDGCLQCPYHGWRFDRDGRMVRLPGAPGVDRLPGIRARALQVKEHDGIVWARYREDARDLPERVQALDRMQRKFIWQTIWRGHIVDVLENVLDPLHTHFVHPGLVRRAGVRRPTTVHLKEQEGGFMVDYRGQGTQSGWLYRLFESARASERAYFRAPGTVQLEYRYRNGSEACISMHFSPLDRDRTRLVGMLHLYGRRVPSWMIRTFLWPFIWRVAMQDRRMLAWQAENTRAFDDRRDVITRYDLVRRQLLAAWGESTDIGSPSCAELTSVLDL